MNEVSPLKSTSKNSINRWATYPIARHNSKKVYDKKTIYFLGSLSIDCIIRLCPRQWYGRYHRGNRYGDILFRASHQTHLRYRCGSGSYRRSQGVWQVFIWRPRYIKDSSFVVRSVYLPDCGGNHSSLILFINRLWQIIQSTEGLESRLSSRG